MLLPPFDTFLLYFIDQVPAAGTMSGASSASHQLSKQQASQNGIRQQGRPGNIFMPPAGGEMRPFAPNNNRSAFNRGGQMPAGVIGRSGRNEASAGRGTGAETGQNENPAGGSESSGGRN